MAYLIFAHNKKGQSVIETALVMPIVVLMLTGLIDIGMTFGNLMIITSISREAARQASVGCSYQNIQTYAQNMADSLDKSKMTLSIIPSEALRQRGEEVIVTVKYDNTILTPVISSIFPKPFILKAKTTMRVE